MERKDLLTPESLQALPLPKVLESLPINVLTEFAQLTDLVEGYMKGLPRYQEYCALLIKQLEEQIDKLKHINQDLTEYEATKEQIKEHINQLEALCQEFLNLQTYQYQLLTSNFNQNFLRQKLANMNQETDEKSRLIVRNLRTLLKEDFDSSASDLLNEFRSSRKTYHLRKEKLYRWNEERVSGFI